MNLVHAPSRQHVIVDVMGYAGSRARADLYEREPGGWTPGYRSGLVPTFVEVP